MRLMVEEQILDEGFRKKVIEEIQGQENQARKTEAYRRHEIYRDKTMKYVEKKLALDGLKPSTLQRMMNRAANISVCKKIVNKKARCYVGGATRLSENANEQPKIDELVKLLEMDAKGKKADRYRELMKNTMIQSVICPVTETLGAEKKQYRIDLRVLSPWQYDVIEDFYNREQAKVVILSDYTPGQNYFNISSFCGPQAAGPNAARYENGPGNGKDEIIADTPIDAQGTPEKSYIWWGSKYHFTTDADGRILQAYSPEQLANPIQMLPFTKISEDQDGQFWATGGEDVIDGSVLINVVLTDMLGIAYMQGWGQPVAKGKNLPETLEGGPHSALMLEYDEGDPVPSFEFVSGNPPLEMWMNSVEQYTALLLSTNDIAPSSIANKLDAAQFPSGIAMLIEQSEAVGSVEDKQKIMQDAERYTFETVIAWQNYLIERNAAADEFKEIGAIAETEVTTKFHSAKAVISEKEKLDNLKARKDLGISTMVDLIRMDNPDLNDQEAEDKLRQILQDRMNRIATTIQNSVQNQPLDGQFNQDVGTPPLAN